MRVDSLQVFAVSLAALVAAVLLLIGVMRDVSLETAGVRALLGWVVLSLMGIGVAHLLRSILRQA